MTFKRRRQIKNEVVSVGVGVSGVTATEPEAVGGIVFITQAASERQKREWRLGAWGEWRRAERKGGFCIFWRAKLHEHSLLSQKFAKKPVYFVSAHYAFTNQNLKISPMSPNGPVFGAARNSHIPVLTWVPVRKVPTIPTDNVQNWLTPIVEPL